MTSTPRLREESSEPTTQQYAVDYAPGEGTDYEVSYEDETFNRSISDVVTSDFHSRIARGEIINNPCTITEDGTTSNGSGQVTHQPGGTLKFTATGAVSQNYATLAPDMWSGFATPSVPFDERTLKVKCLANIDNTPYAFGEDVLELKQTVRFLKNPVRETLELSRAYYRAFRKRRIDKKTSRKTGRRVLANKVESLAVTHSKIWLQFRFAVSPLVRSSIDALDAYSAVVPTMPPRLSARSTAASDSDDSLDLLVSNLTFDRRITTERSGKATILYQVRNPIHDWKYKLGFRVKDLPTTIWQVMPYSFMVDRMFDLTSFSKGVINMLDPDVRILAGSYRTKSEVWHHYALKDRSLSGFTVNSGNMVSDKQFTYQRDVWNPTYSDSVPRLMPGGLIEDATKITDGLALIIANFRGILPR